MVTIQDLVSIVMRRNLVRKAYHILVLWNCHMMNKLLEEAENYQDQDTMNILETLVWLWHSHTLKLRVNTPLEKLKIDLMFQRERFLHQLQMYTLHWIILMRTIILHSLRLYRLKSVKITLVSLINTSKCKSRVLDQVLTQDSLTLMVLTECE